MLHPTRNPSSIGLPMMGGWIVASAWFTTDQVTKWWILEHVMNPPRVIPVSAFFNIVLGWNTGVSFGMLSSAALPPWTLALVAVVVSLVLMVWLARSRTWLLSVALGLMIGGALSNALDRLRHGAVTDFLDFHVGGWHWPTFNLADAGIVCGAIALLLDALARPGTDAPAPRNSA